MKANQKRMLTLFVVFVLLVGIAAMLLQEKEEIVEAKKFFENINEIEEVVLENSSGKFTFERESGEWILTYPERYKADKRKLEDILSEYRNRELVTVISEDRAQFERFGLGKKSITIDGEKFYIGRIAQGFANTYVGNNDKVYRVNGAFGALLDFQSSHVQLHHLMDRSIVEFDKDSIKSLEIIADDKIKLEKIGKTWYNNGKEFQNGEKLVSVLSDTKLTRFYDKDKIGETPDVQIVIRYTEGEKDNIGFYLTNDGIFGSSTHNNIVFSISRYELERIEDLIPN